MLPSSNIILPPFKNITHLCFLKPGTYKQRYSNKPLCATPLFNKILSALEQPHNKKSVHLESVSAVMKCKHLRKEANSFFMAKTNNLLEIVIPFKNNFNMFWWCLKNSKQTGENGGGAGEAHEMLSFSYFSFFPLSPSYFDCLAPQMSVAQHRYRSVTCLVLAPAARASLFWGSEFSAFNVSLPKITAGQKCLAQWVLIAMLSCNQICTNPNCKHGPLWP